ncbi:hypothetical protein E3N88_38987 [Mikania micrantha]|uniref:Uncharacterized protein n=1 Tax=Mikania micrantha TaxID=192012 RepID=A0A5N6LVQ0_9ASTR|nr:hypothetical protein E3N88_38987 [Mikania micrantha]
MTSVFSQPHFWYTQTPSKVLYLRDLPWARIRRTDSGNRVNITKKRYVRVCMQRDEEENKETRDIRRNLDETETHHKSPMISIQNHLVGGPIGKAMADGIVEVARAERRTVGDGRSWTTLEATVVKSDARV